MPLITDLQLLVCISATAALLVVVQSDARTVAAAATVVARVHA